MLDWRIVWDKALNAKEQFLRFNNFSYFETLLKNYPEDGMIYYVLGTAYENKNEKDKALEAYQKAWTLFPMFTWKMKAQEGIDRLTLENSAEDKSETDK